MSDVVIRVRSAELATALATSISENDEVADIHVESCDVHVDVVPSMRALAQLFTALSNALGGTADGYATVQIDGQSYAFEPAEALSKAP